MEIQKQDNLPTNPQRSIFNEIAESKSGILVSECNTVNAKCQPHEELRALIRYVIILWGIKSSSIPQDETAKNAMLLFLKKALYNVPLSELRLAFEYAAENKLDVKIELFGDTFSGKTVMTVWRSYIKYRDSILKSKRTNEPIGVNNVQTITAIFSSPHFKIDIFEKEEKKKVIQSTQREDSFFQECMRRFDKLRRNYGIKNSNGIDTGHIKRNGLNVFKSKSHIVNPCNLEEFVNYKMMQIEIVQDRWFA